MSSDGSPLESASRAGHHRESWIRRIARWYWGYDFFVSYNWASGGAYAVSLAERLRDLGYECFLDRAEFAAGDDWKQEGQNALRNTQRLVIIATREAIQSSRAVQLEVEIFTSRSHRVIPIVFDARFSPEERRQYPTLQRIPESTIEIIEQSSRMRLGPSESVVKEIVQVHRLLRRRTLRARAMLTAILILATAAVVALVFWRVAVWQKGVAVREKLLAESAQLINQSDLLRETQGPKLEESLKLAATAYSKASQAGSTSDDARRAFQQALDLTPASIGAPWAPLGEAGNLRLSAIDGHVVVQREAQAAAGQASGAIGDWDSNTRQFQPAQGIPGGDRQPLATAHGESLRASDSPRWVALEDNGGVIIWDLMKGTERARLPLKHRPGEQEGEELLKLSADGDHALSRYKRELRLWDLTSSEAPPASLPIRAEYQLYALSPTGRWLACARQNELLGVRVKDGIVVLRYPVTSGGGHPLSLGFVEGGNGKQDLALFASWSANQILQMGVGARRDRPSHQAALWELARFEDVDVSVQASESTSPDLRQVREEQFDLALCGSPFSVAVVDPSNPVQWLDVESQISFALGAEPGLKATFNHDGERLLVVHRDGTARLWDLKTRKERLRFTAAQGIKDATFLAGASTRGAEPSVPYIVTLDGEGRLQGWTGMRVDARIEDIAREKPEDRK